MQKHDLGPEEKQKQSSTFPKLSFLILPRFKTSDDIQLKLAS